MFSFMEYLGTTLADRQENPRDDMFTDLVNMEIVEEDGEPRRLTLEQAVNFAALIGSAGTETVARMLGWAALDPRREPGAAGRAGGRPRPDPQLRGGDPPLRGTLAGAEPLVHRGRGGARGDDPGEVEGRDDHRVGRTRRAGLSRRRPLRHPPERSTTTCPSATASTSAWARPWPGRKGGSPSRRRSSASPSGRSTWPARSPLHEHGPGLHQAADQRLTSRFPQSGSACRLRYTG